MDQAGYRQFLQTRKLSNEQIEQSVAMVVRFEAYLSNCQPPSTLELASAEQALAFVDLLIDDGQNSFLDLAAVARYGYFSKNYAIYIAILELVDGSEALEGMYNKAGEVLGEEKRQALFAGIELPPLGVSNAEKAHLMRTVMQRLDATTEDQERNALFADSFRDLQEAYYLEDKKHYAEIGDFDEFLETKRRELIA